MGDFSFDLAHLLSGALLLMSFVMVYQRSLWALIALLTAQATFLTLSIAWQAIVQHAPHLYVTALIAFVFKALVIPAGLRRIARRLGHEKAVETIGNLGLVMLVGIALVALSLAVMLPASAAADRLVREDLAFALAAMLLGLLTMVTRRSAFTQIIGYMALENGLILAAAGARGMPLVVELSIAFSVLIAFVILVLFLRDINARFATIDTHALEHARSEAP
jgi:hydrogenase-4 component E